MEALIGLLCPIFGFVLFASIFGLAFLRSLVIIVPEYERAVVFRAGRVMGLKGPGIVMMVPFVDRPVTVPMRTIVMDVPKQDAITRDNISVVVNAVVYFQVLEPLKAVLSVQDFGYATGQLAQTTMRSIIGEFELDELLSQREKINERLTRILDHETDPWGIKVSKVDLKDIDLPPEMKRAMARQAEAERERRGKIIAAEGELQASAMLSEAAKAMEASPVTIQLRYLQTLTEIASENNSTTIFPVPIELFTAFLGRDKTPK